MLWYYFQSKKEGWSVLANILAYALSSLVILLVPALFISYKGIIATQSLICPTVKLVNPAIAPWTAACAKCPHLFLSAALGYIDLIM